MLCNNFVCAFSDTDNGIWNDICGKNNVPTETTQTSTTDINGYGALAVMTWVENGKERKDYHYCNYIIVYDDDNSYLCFPCLLSNPFSCVL